MEFTEFLTALLALLGQLLEAWPTLVVAVVFVPAVSNLVLFAASKLGLVVDSTKVLFGLNLLAFAGYTVARIAGVDLSGVDPVLQAIATIITTLLGLLGGIAGKAVNRSFWHKVPIKALSYRE